MVGALALSTTAIAQIGPFGRTDCNELANNNGVAQPDYSLIDAMVADATVPGASSYPPICVGKKLIWREADPDSTDADHGSDYARRFSFTGRRTRTAWSCR